MTNLERSLKMQEVVGKISGMDVFYNYTSPHFQALQWLVDEDPRVLCPSDPKLLQRYVVALFYFQLNGDDWTFCSRSGASCIDSDGNAMGRFLTGDDECNWGNLVCNGALFLTEFRIDDNNVQGKLPAELSSLSELQLLDLDHNGISGTIPSSIGNLTELKVIDLDDNALSGSIPEEVYNLVDLQVLDLNNNQLMGTISNNIGNLVNLEFVQFDFNEFDGTVPASVGNLTSLGTFLLSLMLLLLFSFFFSPR